MSLIRRLTAWLPFDVWTGGIEVSFDVEGPDGTIEAVSWSDGQLAVGRGSWSADGQATTLDDVARICATSPRAVPSTTIEELWAAHRRNIESDAPSSAER